MTFDLVLDVPRAGDLIKSYHDVSIVVDPSSAYYIDEGMKIDYIEEKDRYRIVSPNQLFPTLYSL